MTRIRIGVALALLALALLAFPGHASGAPTWEGTWSSTFGEIKMTASGSGTYPNCGVLTPEGLSDGGRTNKGKWTECSSNGKYEFHMSASGLTFDGTYTRGESDTCVFPPCDWDGECLSGACKENDDPAPAQPRRCGGAASFLAHPSRLVCKLGSVPFGSEFSVPGPKPGSTVDISPKPIPATAVEVFIALRELLLEEEREKQARVAAALALTLNDPDFEDAVRGCVLMFSPAELEAYRHWFGSDKSLATLDACRRVAAGTVPKSPESLAGTAAACRTVYIPIVRKDRATKRRREQIVAAVKRQLDVSCTQGPGRLRASIKTSRKGKKLSSVIERRIRVGAGRQLPAGQKSDARLGVRWTARKR